MGSVWDSIKHLRWPGGAPGSQGGRFKKGGSGGGGHEPRALGDTRPEGGDAWAERISADAGKRHQPPDDMATTLRRAELARRDYVGPQAYTTGGPGARHMTGGPIMADEGRGAYYAHLVNNQEPGDLLPYSSEHAAAHQRGEDPFAAGFAQWQQRHGTTGDPTAWAGQISNNIGARRGETSPSDIASALHEDWRQTQQDTGNGTRKAKFKTTTDQAWISAHGTDQVDIANSSYHELPADWQAENKAAADVIHGILQEHGGHVDLSHEPTRLKVGEQIHQAWLSRNAYAKGGELDVPFAQLPRDEQDKDTNQLVVAMSATTKTRR